MRSLHFFLGALLLLASCQKSPVCLLDLSSADGVFLLDDEPFTGSVQCTHPNGKPALEGYLDAGLRHGLFTAWHEDGTKASVDNFHRGKRLGISSSWHPNGNMTSKTSYANDELHGEKLLWSESGEPVFAEQYRHGKLHGKAAAWHPGGKLQSEKHYSDGVLDGECTEWDVNGVRLSQSFFKKGTQDGKQLSWHPNGKKKLEITFRNGQPSGFRSEWDEAGRLVKKERFYHGKTAAEIGSAFLDVIRSFQGEYVGESWGTLAHECYTEMDLAGFQSQNVPSRIQSELPEDASFQALMVAAGQLPAAEWQALRKKGLRLFKPTWQQIGGISRLGQTEAGQLAEIAVARAVVAAADALLRKPAEPLATS